MRLAALCLLFLSAPAWGQGSRSFDGSADYFQDDATPVTSAPLTMACWFNADTDTALANTLLFVGDKDVPADFWWMYAQSNNTVNCVVADGGSTNNNSGGTWVIGQWHHAACVFASATSHTPYLDGVAGTTGTTNRTPDLSDRVTIGRDGDSSPAWEFDGQIASCALWRVALDSGEVADLAGGKSPMHVRPPPLRSWRLQENTATDAAIDETGNGGDLPAVSDPGFSSDGPPIYIPGPPP